MRWPWVARSSHEELVKLLCEQVAELKAERTVLYDRLAAMGLGGPLFKVPEYTPEPEAEELVNPEEEIERILSLKRRPSLMAQAIRQRAVDEMRKRSMGPDVKWIPNTATAALDEAEGKLGHSSR